MNGESDPLTVAVTGATGYIGRFMVDESLANQATVKALVRPESMQRFRSESNVEWSIAWVEGDLLSDAALRELVANTQVVVHLAYEHIPGRYRGGEGDDLDCWLHANLMGTLRLLMAAQAAGVQRFIFLSSRAVHSRIDAGRLLDETHPVHPDSHYGAYKAAVEQFLRSFRAQYGMQTFSVRATGVYGLTTPIERTKWYDIVRSVLDGISTPIEGGGTEVYGGDVARTVWQLSTQSHVEHDVFNLSDLYVARADVARIARDYLGVISAPQPVAFEPSDPLECTRLRDLGISLGGRQQLVQTVCELVDTVREYRSHQ